MTHLTDRRSVGRPIGRLVRYAAAGAGVGAAATAAGYVGLVTGAVPVDLGIGRRSRPLGPQRIEVAAPREVVFDVIAQPYLGRPTRALEAKIRVLERGADMVLAAHFTPVTIPVPIAVGGWLRRLGLGLGRVRLVAQTVETVRFTRPERVDFRLVRGPVPHVVEEFMLTEQLAGSSSSGASVGDSAGAGVATRVAYRGEMAADLWGLGERWSALVARRWEQAVAASLAAIKAEAERRASTATATSQQPAAPER